MLRQLAEEGPEDRGVRTLQPCQVAAARRAGRRSAQFDPDGAISRIEPSARVVAEALGITLQLGKPLARVDQQRLAEALADQLFEAIRRHLKEAA